MKIAYFLCCFAVASAATLPVAIVSQNFEMADDASNYKQTFETADGIKVEESGQLKQITPEDAGIASKGSFSYTSPEGIVISTTWVADENGFQPSGAHLPVAPPMPDHVVKLLADLKAAGVL